MKVLAYVLDISEKQSGMKYKSTLFLLMILSIASVNAQGFKFGVKGGADMHKLTGVSFNNQFSFGYHLGIFATVNVTSRFGIQPEVYFSQVNVDTSSNFSTVYQFNKITNVKLTYLNIPVLFNYSPIKFVTFQVGPQFGILVDKSKGLVSNGKQAFKGGDLSMDLGLQLNITKIRLYGRYVVGLNNINDLDNRDKWKNQTFHLGVGLTL